MGRPEAPERRQPGVDLHERLGPEPIDAPLGFDARLHEAGLAQHAEVLGHGGLRHPQPALDLADYGFVKATLLRSAEKMPEENYGFKPTDTVRSFGQIVGHVADSQ